MKVEMIVAVEQTTSAVEKGPEFVSFFVAHTISNVSFLAVSTRQEKSILPLMLLLGI